MDFKKPKTILLFLIFCLVLCFSRLYNLSKTARFIWDESSDLVNIHQIYVEKKITLIGPISEDGSKVFGSLTYYMLLPFAVLGHFDPVATAYGAAFWGIITGLLILYLVYIVNKKVVWLAAPIIIFWYPLVETGRWAWNPNLILFWVTLSLIFYLRKSDFSKFLSGLFMGLSIHHHYLAAFAGAGFGFVVLLDSLKKKEIRKFFAFAIGIALTIIPFILFDLRHPPGLFLTRILYFNHLGGVNGQTSILVNLANVFNETFQYFGQFLFLKIILIVIFISLITHDLKKKSAGFSFAFVFLIQLIGLRFVSDFFTHYILPAVPFFIVYLIYPRKGLGKILSYSALFILIVSSLLSFPKQITKVSWESDIASTRFITHTIEGEIKTGKLQNVNIAALGSPDPNTYGRRYRDLLLIDGVTIKTKGEYEISDNLFVITTSSLDKIRLDPAYEIKFFKNGPLARKWQVPGSNWNIFLLSRSKSI
ncbi:MAG TPA: hypothetical protein VKC54_00585 [Patescibacteria group bacterium]|nr:hypothetical protein [Patescibacteria group bacterium]